MRRPRPGFFLCLLLVVLACASFARRAAAQANDELAQARRLFSEALRDEDNKQFEVALDKFRKVQQVKDTAAVRYRIGTCFEGLGKWRQAEASYAGAIELAGADPKEADIARASRERVNDLDRRMPQITLTLSDKAPPGAEVEIDHEKVPDASMKTPIAVDPGTHEVTAHAPGASPFRTEITFNEGSRLSLTIPLEASQPGGRPNGSGNGNGQGGAGASGQGGNGQPGDGGAGQGGAGGGGDHGAAGHGSASTSGVSKKTVGFVAAGVGVVLIGTSAVLLLVRHGQINDLKSACPGGVCPLSKQQDLTSERSHAVSEGTIAAVTGIAGVVAVGAGVYLIATSSSSSSSSKPSKTAARLSGYPLPGGGGALIMSGGF